MSTWSKGTKEMGDLEDSEDSSLREKSIFSKPVKGQLDLNMDISKKKMYTDNLKEENVDNLKKENTNNLKEKETDDFTDNLNGQTDNLTVNLKGKETDKIFTEEEFFSEIELVKKTKLGQIFPYHKSEYKRILIIFCSCFIIASVYSFTRDFKDLIIYQDLSQSAKNWLKIAMFLFTFYTIKFSNWAFDKYGALKGLKVYLFASCIIYLIMSIFVLINRFILISFLDGVAFTMFSSSSLRIRNFSFLKPLAEMFFNPVMSIYFLVFEVIPSIFITVVYCTFLSTFISLKNFKRYVPVIIFSNNFASFLMGNLLKKAVSIFLKNTKQEFFKNYIIVNFVIIFVFLLLIHISNQLVSICLKNPLYYSIENQKRINYLANFDNLSTSQTSPLNKKKAKFDMEFISVLKLIWSSKILLSLSLVSIGVNVADSFFKAYSSCVYESYAKFMKDYPSENKIPGFTPTKANVAFPYISRETSISGLSICYSILFPVIPMLFNKYGPILFGSITPIIFICCVFMAFILSMINYPLANSGEGILFGLKLPSFLRPTHHLFPMECFSASISNIFIKVSKFICHATVRENISAMINPSERLLFKGIVDGVVGKGAKTITAFYLISTDAIIGKDCRYSIVLTGFLSLFIVIGWLYSNYFVDKEYKRCKSTNTYLM